PMGMFHSTASGIGVFVNKRPQRSREVAEDMREAPESEPPRSIPAPEDARPLALGIAPFTCADLFDPTRLAELHAAWDEWFKESAPAEWARFDADRACKGEGMAPEAVSEALLAAAPSVARFVGRLFGVEAELEALRAAVMDREPL